MRRTKDNPKMMPCPTCGSDDHLSVCRYESGWRHVECDAPGCTYLGPGEGTSRAAIKSHNSAQTASERADG